MEDTRFIVLSGCSGGGKTTVLAALARRGFTVVPEPGRRIVEEELRGEGRALPWTDLAVFARRAIDVAADDRRHAAGKPGFVFFDRGLVDAAVALQHATGQPASDVLDRFDRYHPQVFMAPPWPEIYVTDSGRRHGLVDAIDEYDRLLSAYRELGYETVILPKLARQDRMDFILRSLR